MKKLIYTLLIAASCTSCNFLDTTIYDNPSGESIYVDETSCMAGLTGIYDVLGKSALYGQNLWGDLDAGTDIMVYNRSYGIDYLYVSLYNYNNTDDYISDTWEDLYTGIDRANDFLSQLANLSDEDCGGADNKAMFEGEAKALRALFYMNLVAYWGEVPLRTTPTIDLTTQLLKKSPQKDIYALIESDLLAAEAGCRPADELDAPGRISKTTAQALLARAYLWEAGYPVYADTWEQARTYAKKVIDSGLHKLYTGASLDANYSAGYPALFINMCSNNYDLTYRESMFEVEFYGNGSDASDETGKVGLYNGIQQSATYDEDVPFAYGWYNATHILLRLYDKKYEVVKDEEKETGDLRKWWNLADYTYDSDDDTRKVTKVMLTDSVKNLSNTKAYPGKWRAEYDPFRPWARNKSSINFPIMRYSDVLLMYAEADNEVNGPTEEAIKYINEVRTRASASSVDLTNLSTKEKLRQFIFEERTRELCYETPRHMELRRMGKEFFFERIRLLSSQDEYEDGKKRIVGYPLDDVFARPALNIADKHIYLPIPQVELNTNTICGQNEGW